MRAWSPRSLVSDVPPHHPHHRTTWGRRETGQVLLFSKTAIHISEPETLKCVPIGGQLQSCKMESYYGCSQHFKIYFISLNISFNITSRTTAFSKPEILLYHNSLSLFIDSCMYLWLCQPFVAVCGLSLAATSRGHSSCEQALGCAGSVVVERTLSCPGARAHLPDQASNTCPLLWQAVSQPLYYQGSLAVCTSDLKKKSLEMGKKP